MRLRAAAPAIGARLVIVAALAASCRFATPESANPEPTAQASGSGAASPSTPVSSPEGTWGPLAVIPPQEGSDLSFAVGTLDITESCVYLVQGGEKTLLFWPADRTSWVKEAQAIRFTNVDGTSVMASDGDAVSVIGGGDSTAESGLSGREWVSQTAWIVPPDASCFAEVRWGAGGLKR